MEQGLRLPSWPSYLRMPGRGLRGPPVQGTPPAHRGRGGEELPGPERPPQGLEEGVMTRLAGTSMVALATAALLASLSLVAWRQARALEVLERLDEVRRELTLSESEKADLLSRVRVLESRGRVVPEAREELRMRMPDASEIVILAGVAS